MSSEHDYQTNVLYEKEVQNFLGANLYLLGSPKLTLVQIEHPVQFGKEAGRIDILAKDDSGAYVVVEIKRGTAGRSALGQVQSYMGAVAEMYPQNRVRGILVAMGLDDTALAALKMTQNIDFFSFVTEFRFTRATVIPFVPSAPHNSNGLAEVKDGYWEKLGGAILGESVSCVQCGKTTRVVLVGHQRVCGMCGSSIQ